jgi:hypothetical protein
VFAYFGGWVWTALLTLPHSIAVNLAWPRQIAKNDNVYGGKTLGPEALGGNMKFQASQ